jgi:hypothetical protein
MPGSFTQYLLLPDELFLRAGEELAVPVSYRVSGDDRSLKLAGLGGIILFDPTQLKFLGYDNETALAKDLFQKPASSYNESSLYESLIGAGKKANADLDGVLATTAGIPFAYLSGSDALFDNDPNTSAPNQTNWPDNDAALQEAGLPLFTLRFEALQAFSGSALTAIVTTAQDGYAGVGDESRVVDSGTGTPVNNQPTGSVAISGIPRQGEVLTATEKIEDADGITGSITFQWKADGVSIPGATSNSFRLTQDEVGKTIRVEASYRDGKGALESLASKTTTAVENVNDSPAGTLIINGKAEEGQRLTAVANIKDADGLGPISYRWLADGAVIPGASGQHYALTEETVGKKVSVLASYQDRGGTDELVSSEATDVVININNRPTGTLVIKGLAREYEILEVDSSAIQDTDGTGTFSYQWRADGADIPSAISNRYKLSQSDVGKIISVVASYTDQQGTIEELASSPTNPVANVNNAPTGELLIYGEVEQGQTIGLINSIDDEDGIGPMSYQWRADGTTIPGATGEKLTLTQREVGKRISAIGIYTDGQRTREEVSSKQTVIVKDVDDIPVGTISILGSPIEGQTIRAVVDSINDIDGISPLREGTYTFSWERVKGNVSTAVGSNSDYYITTQEDVGSSLRARVTYKDKGGFTNFITSQETAIILNINDRPTGSVMIRGNPEQGQQLIADISSINDKDGLGPVAYQWRSNGVAIPGATQATYNLRQDEVGKTISLAVSYTDGLGTRETLTSPPTTPVRNTNDLPSGAISIEGLLNQGEVLTANSDMVSDADGLGLITYNWLADGLPILGAIGQHYQLRQNEVGKRMSVAATYIDGGGTLETLLSNPSIIVTNKNDRPSGLPVILGALSAGSTVSVSTALIDEPDGLGSVLFYQWHADDNPIEKADGASLNLTNQEVGKRITVTVSYTDKQGSAETLRSIPSPPVAAISDRLKGEVKLSSAKLEERAELIADSSVIQLDGEKPSKLSYQWYADGVRIDGAEAESFTPQQAQVGKVISALVSAIDEQGRVIASTWSESSDPIANQNDAPIGRATIAGLTLLEPREDEKIQIDPTTIIDPDGNGKDFTFTWKLDGQIDERLKGPTFSPSDEHVGRNLAVAISYVDNYGKLEEVTYDLGAISGINDRPAGEIEIEGFQLAGQRLSVIDSLKDADGLNNRIYTWQRSVNNGITWTAIKEQDSSDTNSGLYDLTSEDSGALIRVIATYKDGQGFRETILSKPTGRILGKLSEGRKLSYLESPTLQPLQWQLGSGANWQDLTGEVGSSLVTRNDWGGKSVRIKFGEKTSKAIEIEAINHGPGVLKPLEADGALLTGVTLRAGLPLDDNDGIDINAANVKYEWQRYIDNSWMTLPNSQSASYTATSEDAGASIRAKINYIDKQGFDNTIFSNALRIQAISALQPIGTFSDIAEDNILTAPELAADAKPVVIEGSYAKANADNNVNVTVSFAGQIRNAIIAQDNRWRYTLTESDKRYLIAGINPVTATLTETAARTQQRGIKTFSKNLIIAQDAGLISFDPNSSIDLTQSDGIRQDVKDAASIALKNIINEIALRIGQPNIAAAPLGSGSAFLSGADAPADSYGVFVLPGDTRAAGLNTYTGDENGYNIPDTNGLIASIQKPDAGQFKTFSDPIALTIMDVEPGATISVDFTLPQSISNSLPQDLSEATYLKLRGNSFEAYRDSKGVPYYSYIDHNGGVREQGDVITLRLSLTDGSEWDRDGIVNGVIVDPGIAAALLQEPGENNSANEGNQDNSNNSSGNSNSDSSNTSDNKPSVPTQSNPTTSPREVAHRGQGKGDRIAPQSKQIDRINLAPLTFSGGSPDIITGFLPAEDKIILARSAFPKIKSTRLSTIATSKQLKKFKLGKNSAQIIYNKLTGDLVYDQNMKKSGLGSGGIFARFEDGTLPTLTAANFELG